MSLYDLVRDLPLRVEGYELEGLWRDVSSGFTRKTTVIRLRGHGEEGIGEDVTYAPEEHDLQLARGPVLLLGGDWTLDAFSRHVGSLPLFEQEPEQRAALDYRRWGFESAALDLALRQAGLSLGEAIGREHRPLAFVVSLKLGEPPSTERLRRWLALYPGLRFKLDATSAWTDDLAGELRELGCVAAVDLKAHYTAASVGQAADLELYRRVVDHFPHAWIEDPAVTATTRPILEPHRARVTWDAVIHSVADIEALPWPPRTVNVKPSRFGSIERLLAAYDHCAERGIAVYGGGQFELGPGRGQIQLLASLFHADSSNDVAPGGFNEPEPQPGLPSSPLTLTPRSPGFGLA